MKSSRESDQLLVRLAQDGSEAAFNALVLRYRRLLIRQVMHFARDANEAEDIVQDALMSAFGSLKHFRGDSSFFTWLYRIAINSAKHSWNQSARRLPRFSDISDTSDNDHMLDDREIDLETPEALMESRQILRLLNDVIERLPPEQREALLLRELDGLSYEEIAAAMHCPVGTVRSRVSRAREAISAAISISLDGPMSKH
jgi:RNA polymerase sigma-70 factor (ECF subfamily)